MNVDAGSAADTEGSTAASLEALSALLLGASSSRALITNMVLRQHGLSWTGFAVLWSVWANNTLPTWQAARAAGISKATLSGVVQTLAARGWLDRAIDPLDRRQVNLTVTDEGARLVQEVFPKFEALLTRMVEGMTPEQLGAMRSSLVELIVHIEDLTDVLDVAELSESA